jgi:hypothetical protein
MSKMGSLGIAVREADVGGAEVNAEFSEIGVYPP